MKFASEADMLAKFMERLAKENARVVDMISKRGDRFGNDEWIAYPETCGFDLVLRGRHSGIQVGIEAKLSLNAKSLCQAVCGAADYYSMPGPDYRAVLVPSKGQVSGMSELAAFIGVTVIVLSYDGCDWRFRPELPSTNQWQYSERRSWHPWVPAEQLKLPDYIPDTIAGTPSPRVLSPWKISAIKLCILLDRRGYVTRRDMKTLQISPTRWCDAFHGYLSPAGKEGRCTHYVACDRTPDFRQHHPRNYEEIEDDWNVWTAGLEDLP